MTFEQWQAGDFWVVYSNRIKQYRAKNNLTQREFAKLCGVSYSTVQAIENCKRKVTYVIVSRINYAMEGKEND